MESPSIIAKKLIIKFIRIYQIGISPIINNRCRFPISCSQYGINSIMRFGILKGSWRTLIRILQCHPWTLNSNKNLTIFKAKKIQDIIKMDSQRNFLVIAFLIISFILWQSWEKEQNQQSNINQTTNNNQSSNLKESCIYNQDLQQNNTVHSNHTIMVKTNVLLLKINTYEGDIEEAYLLNYLEDLHSKQPFCLLNNINRNKYQVHSGLINIDAPYNSQKNNKSSYTNICKYNEYHLSENNNELTLTLTYTDPIGIKYTKQYLFKKNDYYIYIYYTINNLSKNPLKVQLFGNLIQSIHFDKKLQNNEDGFPLYSYQGAGYSTDKENYHKYSFKDMKNKNLHINTNQGWIAMLQKYFVIAWIPTNIINNTFYTTYLDNNYASINFKSDIIYIPINKKDTLHTILWIGPKIQNNMKSINPNLNLTIDYGWLRCISQPLFKLLQFIYTNIIHNWGMSIILITLFIRLIMYPLTKAQYTSMAKMRMLQPKLTEIQEKYKNDKYLYHQKTINLYKKAKVNPLGGCLPLFIQMPIFLALYYMLSGSVELRHAKFILWINDLSVKDPYYILPIIMGITMFFIQKISPTTVTDPIQKKIMTSILIIFTIFFLWFPSGLVLYYIISNLLTIAQQQIIYRGLSKQGLHKK